MHVTSCLHPQRVYNKYSKEYVYAPCGKCPECLKRKSLEWTERLTQERYSWRYCVFFTLTYSPEHVPTLHLDDRQTYAYDLSHVHYHPVHGDVIIDIPDVLKSVPECLLLKTTTWIQTCAAGSGLYYLSVGDAQRFIKRLRINISRHVKSKIKYDKQNGIKTSLTDKDASIRYYICGEYGETTLRPHYHGLLFFNSEFTASCIEEIISKTWKFGLVDSSFVADNNASYVAGYVNCTYNLPQILLHKRIRPFALFSRHPFIGSLCHSSQEVKEIFFSASPDQVIFNHAKSAFDNVPLWRSYQRKLYPKISRFGTLSHSDRVNLYRAFERYEKTTEVTSLLGFLDYVCGHNMGYLPTLYTNYVRELLNLGEKGRVPASQAHDLKQVALLVTWYYTSSRVCVQARSFGISVREYVSIIERYYNNVEKSNLKKQYEYEETLAEKKNLVSAFALDREFVRTIVNLELSDLSAHEIDVLSSFGIDIGKFYSENLMERERYRYECLPDTCLEYRTLSLDSEVWLSEHTKTKRKNDYLLAHPDMANRLWSDD